MMPYVCLGTGFYLVVLPWACLCVPRFHVCVSWWVYWYPATDQPHQGSYLAELLSSHQHWIVVWDFSFPAQLWLEVWVYCCGGCTNGCLCIFQKDCGNEGAASTGYMNTRKQRWRAQESGTHGDQFLCTIYLTVIKHTAFIRVLYLGHTFPATPRSATADCDKMTDLILYIDIYCWSTVY